MQRKSCLLGSSKHVFVWGPQQHANVHHHGGSWRRYDFYSKIRVFGICPHECVDCEVKQPYSLYVAGPFDMMDSFDDELPQRRFDNFQFVNFTGMHLHMCRRYCRFIYRGSVSFKKRTPKALSDSVLHRVHAGDKFMQATS